MDRKGAATAACALTLSDEGREVKSPVERLAWLAAIIAADHTSMVAHTCHLVDDRHTRPLSRSLLLWPPQRAEAPDGFSQPCRPSRKQRAHPSAL